MTRQLGGILWGCSQNSKTEQDVLASDPNRLLSAAKENLAKIDHVLIYENLSGLSAYLQCAFGCSVSVPTLIRNSRGNKTLDAEIPQETVDEILAHNTLDTELYAFAQQLYEKHPCANL